MGGASYCGAQLSGGAVSIWQVMHECFFGKGDNSDGTLVGKGRVACCSLVAIGKMFCSLLSSGVDPRQASRLMVMTSKLGPWSRHMQVPILGTGL